MSKKDKLLGQMQNNPQDWRIENLITLAEAFEIEIRNDGGSHHVFSYPGIANNLCIPARKPIKPIYIKHFLAFIQAVQEIKDAYKNH